MELDEFHVEKSLEAAPHWLANSRSTTAKIRTAHSPRSVGSSRVTLRTMFTCPFGALTGLLRQIFLVSKTLFININFTLHFAKIQKKNLF